MSCIFGNLTIAVTVTPIFVIPMLAFGGFLINRGSLPVYFHYLQYLSYFGYAYESLAILEWSSVTEIPGEIPVLEPAYMCSRLSRYEFLVVVVVSLSAKRG